MSVYLLAIAYVAVAALLLNVWLSTAWSTTVKISLIVVVTGLYAASYQGLREIQGWPTQQTLPATFHLLWASIEEPDKVAGSQGQIYLWIRKLDRAQQPTGKPRAYKLPWRLELAEQVAAALRRTEAGESLNGSLSRQPIEATEEDTNAEHDPVTGDQNNLPSTNLDQEPIQLEFSQLPRAPLPAKAS
jgi:hypothetical protein